MVGHFFNYLRHKNGFIYNQDILNFNIEKICKKNSIVFGNLPYNISSQILIKILNFKNWPPNIKDVIFMFQKELGEKIIGKFRFRIRPGRHWAGVLLFARAALAALDVERHLGAELEEGREVEGVGDAQAEGGGRGGHRRAELDREDGQQHSDCSDGGGT